MEALQQISLWIPELLGTHSCVTIPGLGSFIYREAPASGNPFTHELKPAVRTIFFNNAISADDGVLVNHIREKSGVSYNDALKLTQDAASEIRLALEKKRSVPFGELGNFFLNSENQVFFLPLHSLNLSHQTFGLPIIKLDELANRAKPASLSADSVQTGNTVKPTTESAVEEFEEASVVEVDADAAAVRKSSFIWKAAAVLAFVAMSVTGVYYLSTSTKLFKSGNNGPVASTAPVTDQVSETPAYTSTEDAPEENTMVPAEPAEVTAIAEETRGIAPAATISNEDYLKQLFAGKGEYYVLGGMYMNAELAETELNQWNASGVSATVFKAKNSSLFKVILGRFESEAAASAFMENMPVFSGVHISVRQTKLLTSN